MLQHLLLPRARSQQLKAVIHRKNPLTSYNEWPAPLWSLGGKHGGALNILIVNIFAI